MSTTTDTTEEQGLKELVASNINAPDFAEHLRGLISERLAALALPELAALGRPNGPAAVFLRVEGDLFVYQVKGKRVHAHEGEAFRRELQKSRLKAKASDATPDTSGLVKFFTREVTLSRKTVARNAITRILADLTNQQEPS